MLNSLKSQVGLLAAMQAPAAQQVKANSVFTVRFDFGSTRVTIPPEVTAALVEDAKASPLVLLRGRTDGTTDAPAESRIARDRAAAVRDYLVAVGVDPARIRATYQVYELLKPVEADHHHAKTGFFGWFNRGFASGAKRYEGWVGRLLPRAGRSLLLYGVIVGVAATVYLRLPTSFLPNEDQGTLLVNVQLPPGATRERTRAVMEQVEGFMLKQPEVQSMVGVLGFSFSGTGQNAALGFVTLKDWDERKGADHTEIFRYAEMLAEQGGLSFVGFYLSVAAGLSLVALLLLRKPALD